MLILFTIHQLVQLKLRDLTKRSLKGSRVAKKEKFSLKAPEGTQLLKKIHFINTQNFYLYNYQILAKSPMPIWN